MKNKSLLSINDFSTLSRISRYTLRFYDIIGLISPVLRGANNYRYYSVGQLGTVNLIRTLQSLGMSLEEIREAQEQRSPENLDVTLANQLEQVEENIDNWIGVRTLLRTLQSTIHSVMDVTEDSVEIQQLEEESIILGDRIDYSDGKDAYDGLRTFYQTMNEKVPPVNLNYPVWAMFTKERVEKKDLQGPDYYYFYNPAGVDKRPGGTYVVGYHKGGYGESQDLYRQMFDFIDQNGWEISGNAYEEYPLNELCVVAPDEYLIRILIQVEKKQS